MTSPQLTTHRRIAFGRIAGAALNQSLRVVTAFLATYRIEGQELTALNPLRSDSRLGSFRVNLATGRWSDFADASAKGGDLISLVAYLRGCGQRQAALDLADALGVDPFQ